MALIRRRCWRGQKYNGCQSLVLSQASGLNDRIASETVSWRACLGVGRRARPACYAARRNARQAGAAWAWVGSPPTSSNCSSHACSTQAGCCACGQKGNSERGSPGCWRGRGTAPAPARARATRGRQRRSRAVRGRAAAARRRRCAAAARRPAVPVAPRRPAPAQHDRCGRSVGHGRWAGKPARPSSRPVHRPASAPRV